MKRFVLDTNVVVSGLLNPHGAPGLLLSAAVASDFVVLYDDRILGEYADVLLRPKFGFAERYVRLVLAALARGEAIVARPLEIALPDPDDLSCLEVAVAGAADALVTGNPRHFPRDLRAGVEVIGPVDARW